MLASPCLELPVSAVVIKLIGLAVVLGFATLVWVASVRMKDASVVDRVWGLLFVIYGGVYAALGDGYLPRRVLILVLVTIWGLRLSGFITWRNRVESALPRAVVIERAPASKAGGLRAVTLPSIT
jgi:steroid 5-alpha reductase family enzyme